MPKPPLLSRRFFLRQGLLLTWVSSFLDGGLTQTKVSIPVDTLCDPRGNPNPEVREIFLLECPVAGTSHVERIRELEPGLTEGVLLGFKREPENLHDGLAILILDAQGEKLGYVPREKNEALARLMDAGKVVFARLQSKQWRGNWLNLSMQVFMRDEVTAAE